MEVHEIPQTSYQIPRGETGNLQCWIPEAMKQELKRLSFESGLTLSRIVTALLEAAMGMHNPNAPKKERDHPQRGMRKRPARHENPPFRLIVGGKEPTGKEVNKHSIGSADEH